MFTSTPDTTRQLVADRHDRLAAGARPRSEAPPAPRSQDPPRLRWRAVARVLVGRT